MLVLAVAVVLMGEAGVPMLLVLVLVLVLVRREVRMTVPDVAVRRHLVRERGQDRRCGRRHGRAVGRERGRGGRGERRDGRRRGVHAVVGVRVEVVERPGWWWCFLKSMPNSDADTPMRMVMVMGRGQGEKGQGERGEESERSVSSDDG